MAQAWREVFNPADTDMRYVLWDNGRIDANGGALPITGTPTFFNTVPPAGTPGPARALQITDWSTPSGYLLDWAGTVTAFGQATPPASQAAGVPFFFPIAIDFFMNPLANGQGYWIDVGGTIHEFGGATPITSPTAVNINTGQQYVRIVFETFGGKYYAMTSWGAPVAGGGAAAITVVAGAQTAGVTTTSPPWPGWSIAKAIRIYDFTLGRGWILDGWGGIHATNGAETVIGQGITNVNYWPGWDIARDLNILDNGTGAGPLTTTTLDGLGPTHLIVSSTAPVVDVTGPSGTITTTTRPTIQWTYSDAEQDAQVTYHIKVFSSAQYGIGGFDPSSSPNTYEVIASSPTVFFHVPIFDFTNGTWRAYVQATDTSGLTSAWDFIQWTQNVTPPPTPTVTPTAGLTALDGISVLVHSTSPPGGTFYGVQYQDQDMPLDPWRWVRGGDALIPDGSGNATVVDKEPRFGVVRQYRAISYKQPTGDIIVSPFSITATGKQNDRTTWTLTDPLDTAKGGKVHLMENTFRAARPIIASAFQPAGRRTAIVFTDGTPKGLVGELQLILPLPADHAMVEAIIGTGNVLYLRDPYGRGWYLQPAYDAGGHLRGATGGTAAWVDELISAPPDCGEDAPSGSGFYTHATLPIIEVDRPLAGPSSGALALTG